MMRWSSPTGIPVVSVSSTTRRLDKTGLLMLKPLLHRDWLIGLRAHSQDDRYGRVPTAIQHHDGIPAHQAAAKGRRFLPAFSPLFSSRAFSSFPAILECLASHTWSQSLNAPHRAFSAQLNRESLRSIPYGYWWYLLHRPTVLILCLCTPTMLPNRRVQGYLYRHHRYKFPLYLSCSSLCSKFF